ncbi:MAG TPA: MFS transporter [Gammaproteobacteria bacterium]|jgi:EmrB/QacA subfamily drug resistance transporter|nr:MFS transporter [Gammaproteobacteria bacterium]
MQEKSDLNRKVIIFIVSLAGFMEALDTTILNTAIPAISRSLHVNPVDLKIALISYLMMLAIFIPVSGWLADKFGLKRVFQFATVVFTLSSLWCGFAYTVPQLVLARSVQGLGGALMLPLGRLIILRSFPRHEVVDVINHVIMVVSVGLMLGPLAGGVITDHFSWSWIFWVNVPVGIFAFIIGYFFLTDYPPRHVRPFDFIGFTLFGGGLATLTFALSYLSESSTNQHTGLLILFISILMLANYFLYARWQPHPILNTSLFKKRTFLISILGNLFARLSFGGVPFLLPLLLQISLGYSAALSGLLMVPIAFGVMIVKVISLRALRKMGYKKTLVGNTILVSLMLWMFQVITGATSPYSIAALTFLFGLLISMQYSAMNSLAYSDLDADDLSAATSIFGTTQQLSQSFGVAVAAMLLHYYSHVFNGGFILTPTVFHHAFLAMGFLTLFTTIIFVRLKPNDGHQMLNKPQEAS